MLKFESLPKGFRFRPTDEELINHYLRRKINGLHSAVQVIPEVDVCKREPWDLPAISVIKSDDREWFFFCPRDRKYPNGHRSNRATEAGYWKATGKDRTIKSRRSMPSGRPNTQLIGMKKTLVFYKGRAPKGERTNWIMHEYRATEPDLDGSGPGQGDYVLCRLFHKIDDKLDNSNYDEVEPTGSSPCTGKSSPDDVTSDLLQEPSGHGTEIMDVEDVKKQSAHEADQLTSMMQEPVGGCESIVSGPSGDQATAEVHAPLVEIPKFEESINNQIDMKIFNTLQTHNYADSGACMGSPFAYDFGYDPNGLHFQDGTSEQDASLAELFKDLQNFDNSFCMYPPAHMKFAAASDNLVMPEQINCLEQSPTAFSEVNHFLAHDESDALMAPSQYILQAETSPAFRPVEPYTAHTFYPHDVREEGSFVNGLLSSNYKREDSLLNSHMIRDRNTPGIGRNAIHLRSRPPQNQTSTVYTDTQGTAPRRIHLVKEFEVNSISVVKSKDAYSVNGNEPQQLLKEGVKSEDRSRKSHGCKQGQSNHLGETSVEPPAKCSEKKGNGKLSLMPSPSMISFRKGASYLNVYVVSIYIVIVMSVVVSLGFWKCPSLNAPAPYN